MKQNSVAKLGFGLGLRAKHYSTILATEPKIDWLEILTENYLIPGGKPLYFLDKISELYPLVMHGVSLSIGSCDPLDFNYLHQVKTLSKRINAKWISDHLCWTGINGINTHDLLPIPYTTEALKHIVQRVKQVQDFLGQQILLENPSTYVQFDCAQMSEWEFLTELAIQADCLILLDINNIYVSSYNHQLDPYIYLNNIPANRVQQIHLAGHSNQGKHILDTHDAAIIEPVWDLYKAAVARFGNVATMIERDDNIPELQVLIAELNIARSIYAEVTENSQCII